MADDNDAFNFFTCYFSNEKQKNIPMTLSDWCRRLDNMILRCETEHEIDILYQRFFYIYTDDFLRHVCDFEDLLQDFKEKRLTRHIPLYPNWLNLTNDSCNICFCDTDLVKCSIPIPSRIANTLTFGELWFYGCEIPIRDNMSNRCKKLIQQYNVAKTRSPLHPRGNPWKNGAYCSLHTFCLDGVFVVSRSDIINRRHLNYKNPTEQQSGSDVCPLVKISELLHLYCFLIEDIPFPKRIIINVTPSHICNCIPIFYGDRLFYQQFWEYHVLECIPSYEEHVFVDVNDVKEFMSIIFGNYKYLKRCNFHRQWIGDFATSFETWFNIFTIYIFEAIHEFHQYTNMCHHDLTFRNLLLELQEAGEDGIHTNGLFPDFNPMITIRIADFDLAIGCQKYPAVPRSYREVNSEFLIDYMTFLFNTLLEFRAIDQTVSAAIQIKISKCLVSLMNYACPINEKTCQDYFEYIHAELTELSNTQVEEFLGFLADYKYDWTLRLFTVKQNMSCDETFDLIMSVWLN